MAAAARDANNNDDDDRCRCHPSISADDITTTDPTFLQEREAFYTEFLQFAHSFGVSTTSTNEAQNDSVTAASNAAKNDSPAIDDPDSICAFLSELDALHHELLLRLPKPSASPPCTPANDDCDTNDCNIIHAKSDRDDDARDNNDHNNTNSRNAAYNNDNHDINKRVNNECDNTDRYNPSTCVATPSTNENIIDHEPAEFAVALSNPPTATDPELHLAFQNLDELHSKMQYLLHPSDTFPSKTSNTSGAMFNAS